MIGAGSTCVHSEQASRQAVDSHKLKWAGESSASTNKASRPAALSSSDWATAPNDATEGEQLLGICGAFARAEDTHEEILAIEPGGYEALDEFVLKPGR